MTREVWRKVPSVPRLRASNLGRLRLDPIAVALPNWGVRLYGGTPTLGAWDGTRYVWQYGRRTRKVARLVCEAFKGPPPPGRSVCMHADENARNNRPTNLSWGTQRENLNAPGFLEYCRGRTGESNPHIKGRTARQE